MEVRKGSAVSIAGGRSEKLHSRLWLILKILLIVGSVFATIKVIFVDYTLDEEYQIVMAYRNLAGDNLFGTMWEPHQTSAFACIWLMQLFQMITGGTTGVVLFLRVVTTGIQLLLSYWFVRVVSRLLEKDYAFLLGCCYFNMVPKIIQIPEFSNLQLWFLTVTVLSLAEYYGLDDSGQLQGKRWLLTAGIGMAMEVLSYPSSLILFPFFLIYIFLRSGKASGKKGRAWSDGILFSGTCGICAAVWLWVILSRVSWQEFVRNISYILEFDLTHDVSLTADYRILAIIKGIRTLSFLLAVIVALAALMWLLYRAALYLKRGERLCRPERSVCAVFLVLASECVQFFYWVILQKGYEEPQIHLLVLFLAAALVWRTSDGRKRMLSAGILSGALTILAVIYMSDLGIWYAIPHGMLGAVLAAAVLICALEQQLKDKSRLWISLVLFTLAFSSVFGKGFTLRAGTTDTNSVLGIRGLIKEGPAAGIFTSYMQAYIMNSDYADFSEYVQEGENCLIVTNMVGTAGTSPYLFRNLSVSHFSIVDPTSYDERLAAYWELYPEKKPDVIVVDCWFGNLMEDEDNWIMQYIENEFGYSEVEDGKYVRFYRR